MQHLFFFLSGILAGQWVIGGDVVHSLYAVGFTKLFLFLWFISVFDMNLQQIFRDIVDGRNPGCGEDGFAASIGWDPITGLGVPKVCVVFDFAM